MVVGDFPLQGKIAVITGGGSGINLAFVRAALARDAQVLIADLKLLPEAEQVISASGGNAAFVKCDVSHWPDLEALPGQVSESFGPGAVADVWVAGAGVFEPRWSSFHHDTETDCYKQMQINAAHPIKLTRVAMRSALGANKPLVVLIVASLAGVMGAYANPIYCASKHALLGFTKSMARADSEENVKVVSICPGLVSTPLWTGEDMKDTAKQYGFSEDASITATDVAQAMLEMVESSKYPGGSLLGISKEKLRDPLESVDAFPSTPEMKAWEDVNFAPMRAIYGKERKVQTNATSQGLS